MMDWLVYHSQKTVGQRYASLGAPIAYSKQPQKKLCFGDRIWVIEGSSDIPTRYTLVDCFRYADTKYPPFLGPFSGSALCILGKESLLPHPVTLDMTEGWQEEIRDRFLTKHRFFVSLATESKLVAALERAAGVAQTAATPSG